MSAPEAKAKKSTIPKGIDRCIHFTSKEERCKLKKVSSGEYCHIHTEKPKKPERLEKSRSKKIEKIST